MLKSESAKLWTKWRFFPPSRIQSLSNGDITMCPPSECKCSIHSLAVQASAGWQKQITNFYHLQQHGDIKSFCFVWSVPQQKRNLSLSTSTSTYLSSSHVPLTPTYQSSGTFLTTSFILVHNSLYWVWVSSSDLPILMLDCTDVRQ